MDGKIKPLFSWRAAICESALGSTTRHVALTLSLYMSERGDSAHPGARRLARDTGLSERSVRAQLGILVDGGWLVLAERGGLLGEARHANVYQAQVPDPCTTFTREPRSPVNMDARTPAYERTRPLNHVHPISPENSPENSPMLIGDEFERFWRLYPRKVGKRKAQEAFGRAVARGGSTQVLAGARRYADDPNRIAEFTAHPTTWLNRDGWLDEPLPARVAGRQEGRAGAQQFVDEIVRKADAGQ